MDPITLIRDIMTTEVLTITENTPLIDATKLFIDHKFSGIPVVDKSGLLLGLITEYNVITAASNAVAEGKLTALTAQTVGDVMEKNPLTLLFDDTFDHGLAVLFEHHRVNPIPIIDQSHKLVGIVSRHDFLKLIKMYGHT